MLLFGAGDRSGLGASSVHAARSASWGYRQGLIVGALTLVGFGDRCVAGAVGRWCRPGARRVAATAARAALGARSGAGSAVAVESPR